MPKKRKRVGSSKSTKRKGKPSSCIEKLDKAIEYVEEISKEAKDFFEDCGEQNGN